MRLSLIKIFLAIIIGAGLARPVLAVGVGVNPSSLDFKIESAGGAHNQLTVTNPSQEPGLFIISLDDLANWFTISPAELRLEAGESQQVEITVKPEKVGSFATSLSVIGYPLDTREFKAGSGLKVPLRFTAANINHSYFLGYVGWALIILALIGALGFWHYYRRRHSWRWRLRRLVHFW
jgi:hypothetical protein